MASVRVALVGCGSVARRYARRIGETDGLELVGVTDVAPDRAAAVAGEFGIRRYDDLGAVLADDAVDAVVNLTVPQAHAAVTATALGAGKHVHTEKPVALTYEEASELARLAERRGVRLSCAPTTWLGAAQQTAWKVIRDGGIGTVRVAYAEANWGRIERWHGDPETLYAVGPVVDVGIYPLTILTMIFGPARRVTAYGTVLERDRVTLAGAPFALATDDFVVALLELAGGVVVRLTASFYVEHYGKQRGIEFHGDRGSLFLATWADSDSRLELASYEREYTAVPLVREPYTGIDWGSGLRELAEAVAERRPHRTSADHAAHVVEILGAISEASRGGATIELASTFEPRPPMEWAR
ncbi:MAG: Gfo/Idh/MocA family oxidoreductase [Thermoleophilia bacterium]|nr:Gfo/Idh/MocA family oxidoreductase [Thermoleophilia bacterium]